MATRYWLMKCEPDAYTIDDLERDGQTSWEGVRNYQARNFMRDQMQPGDVVAQYSDASHVGIYIGDGMMVHASTYGIPVRVESVHSAPIYNVRRY